MMNREVLLAACLLLFTSQSGSAEIYKWLDEYGNTQFSDSPPAGKKLEALDLKINTYSAVEVTPLVERLGKKDKVVIYTAAWCGICNQAKKYFKDNNIPYLAYDVEKSRTGKIDFKLLKGRSVPIIILGGQRMNGFTVARFDALYQQQMQIDKEDVAKEGG